MEPDYEALMKELIQKKDLPAYLRGLAAASMLVVSMSTPVFDIASTLKSSYEMAHVVENYGQYIGDGPYMIESKEGHEWKDTPIPDPIIAGYALAFTAQARLTRTGEGIGGHNTLHGQSASGHRCTHRSLAFRVTALGLAERFV